jgi:hypothetical protein
VSGAAQEGLRAEQGRLGPLELLRRTRDSQAALAALSSGEPPSGQGRESPEQFLAGLAEPWRQGEARPTHRARPVQPRAWRARKGPSEAAWPEVLSWSQQGPEATAKSLFERLGERYPGRFPEGQLRAPQRRVRGWRRARARDLVHGRQGGEGAAETTAVTGAKADGGRPEGRPCPPLLGSATPRRELSPWQGGERFEGMSSGAQWAGKKQTPGPVGGRASSWDALGAPSAGSPLDGVLASRALPGSPGSPTVTEAAVTNKAEKRSRKVRICFGASSHCYSRKIRTP